MRQFATFALVLLTVIVAAVYLPMLYEMIFFARIEKTHLLFSPVTQRFIYKEKIVGSIPPEAEKKSEDHHAEIAYRDADGTYYSRVEFEKNLPFIYYKNMELWGLMPLVFGGRSFDKQSIKKNRQVLELKPGEIKGRSPQTPLWPLLESNPGQARLVFPEDRFRMTTDTMQFVNADFNKKDKSLTMLFTKALKDEGFSFPAQSINGKFTILKPFDEGIFMVDAGYHVFHLKRRNGEPVVIRTPIDPGLKTRQIKVSENKRQAYYGFLLAEDGSLYLMTYDNYRLVKLPLEHYDPDNMEFKLLVNPLYCTAIWSDQEIIRAVAMDRDYRPLDRYTHRMSRAVVTPMQRIHEVLFPFSLKLEARNGEFMHLAIRPGGWLSLMGLLGSLAAYMIWHWLWLHCRPNRYSLCLVAFTGIYGLITVTFIGSET